MDKPITRNDVLWFLRVLTELVDEHKLTTQEYEKIMENATIEVMFGADC
jgi:hypothetical protein